jgi:putative nucleotidyltransferase with HDIG domain
VRISSLLQDYNVSQKAIADAVGCDPMLASRVLRLVNSPIYPFQQEITSLTNAVCALGNKAIYEMVIVGLVADSFAREIRHSVIGRENWLHSLATALAARELCDLKKMRGLDEAFCCGLLHDIGKLLILRADSSLFAEIYQNAEGGDLTAVERECLGFDHAQAGALAARRWRLSDPVCHMILYHHDPTNTTQSLMMTHIINIADNLTYFKNQKQQFDDDFLYSSSMLALGFTGHELEAVWIKVLVNLREMLQVFFR